MPGTRKLGRTTAHRKAMLRAMVTYLLENGKIETTVTRAKEVRALTEKMITLGKDNTLHARRQAMSFITKESVAKKLFDEIAPKYADRNGGYTRIYKTGPRRGDAAEMALIMLVDLEPAKAEEAADAKGKKSTKKAPAKKAEDKKAESKKTEDKKDGTEE